MSGDREPLPEFLVRGRLLGGKARIVHSAMPWVRYGEKLRVKRVVAGMREVEQTGEDKASLRVQSRTEVTAHGFRQASQVGDKVPNTAAGLKQVVRRLRPQEREALDAIDEQIEEAQAHLESLRRHRAEVVAEAWSKGHVVRLNEIEVQRWKGRAS